MSSSKRLVCMLKTQTRQNRETTAATSNKQQATAQTWRSAASLRPNRILQTDQSYMGLEMLHLAGASKAVCMSRCVPRRPGPGWTNSKINPVLGSRRHTAHSRRRLSPRRVARRRLAVEDLVNQPLGSNVFQVGHLERRAAQKRNVHLRRLLGVEPSLDAVVHQRYQARRHHNTTVTRR